MPRISNYPIILDSCLTLTIGYFIKNAKFYPGATKFGIIGWKNTYYINPLIVKFQTAIGHTSGELLLHYSVNNQQYRYKIEIVSKMSNIGKGLIYFFICPFSGKPCKNLYFINNLFVHRTLHPNCCYASQTYSNETKQIKKCIEVLSGYNELNLLRKRPYFKSQYRGKSTRLINTLTNKRDRLHERCNDQFRDWIEALLQDKKDYHS